MIVTPNKFMPQGMNRMPDEVVQELPTPASLTPDPVQAPAFASPLKLSEEQIRKFQSSCLLRIVELQKEMGLSETNEVLSGSWMWLRKCHEAYYQGDLTWRLAFGGIFLKSNITLGSGIRHVRYNAARCQDDLLGTSPFMAALSVKPQKAALAKAVETYIQREIEKSKVRNSLREAQKIAIYRNECVVKTGYAYDVTPFVGEATVLVDVATGAPIKTPVKGIFVYEHDDLVPSPSVEGLMLLETDTSFGIAQHPDAGFVLIPATGEIPQRIGRYQYFAELPQELVRKKGVYAQPIDYRSFLCPLKVENIHDADTVVHLYLETPSKIQKVYGGIDVSQQYFSYWNQPGQNKPKYEQGEQDLPTSIIHQQIIIAEVYRKCDPDETGEEKEIFAVFDYTNRKCIYYNYLANHMGKRPFDSIPGVERVPGRWYGRGIYGMLDSHLFYEDVEASRSFFKNSMNATIQFAYKDAVDDWKNGQPPVVGTGDTFWVNSSWDMEGKRRPVWRENLSENYAPDLQLMNVMRQSADSLVGAISTASANQSGFDASNTATGNQLVQQASDVITKATEQDQSDALTDILSQVVNVTLEHLEDSTYIEDSETGLLFSINRNEARNLSRDVRLLLTRSRSTQLLNTSGQAIQIGKDYHMLLKMDPQQAKALRPAYIGQLKGLEQENADELCPDVTDQMIADALQQQQQAAEANQKPPSESISIRVPDLIGRERQQALQRFGIEVSTPEEQAQHMQMEVYKAQAKLDQNQSDGTPTERKPEKAKAKKTDANNPVSK